jgi:hypothetical protein
MSRAGPTVHCDRIRRPDSPVVACKGRDNAFAGPGKLSLGAVLKRVQNQSLALNSVKAGHRHVINCDVGR